VIDMTKREKLIELRKKALADKKLPLRGGATNLVFGNGNPEAEILFIGEAPGHWEDQKGIPFVGNAGLLLDQTLLSVGMNREDVFVTNMVMYRPPENRDPTPKELKAFEPYVNGIVGAIEPKIIVTLGRFSMAKFLPGVFISSVHGKPREINWKGKNLIVVPMYHPAAALRNGEVKLKFKRDFEILREGIKMDDKSVKIEEVKEEVRTKQMELI